MTWIEYYLKAAEKSKWNLELWVRYLNKTIHRDEILLSREEIEILIHSEKLTSVQRIFLELAVQPDTLPWQMTVEMSEPTRFRHLNAVLKSL
jgi:hypothetical protein